MVDRILGRAPKQSTEPPAEAAPEPTAAERRAAVWSRVQLARNLRRPRTLELLAVMADEVIELHGDRLFGDDEADIKGGKISVSSPIARALIGKYAGDVADVNAPGGIRHYEIVDVHYL